MYTSPGKVASRFLFCSNWHISKQLFNQRRSWNLIRLGFQVWHFYVAVWYKVNIHTTSKQDKKQVIHLHLAPTIWVSMSQRDQLLILSLTFYAIYRRNPLPDLLSLGVLAYSWSSMSRKLEDSCFCMQRDFYYCTAVNTGKTGSSSFSIYPSIIFLSVWYIFALHMGCCHILFMVVM